MLFGSGSSDKFREMLKAQKLERRPKAEKSFRKWLDKDNKNRAELQRKQE